MTLYALSLLVAAQIERHTGVPTWLAPMVLKGGEPALLLSVGNPRVIIAGRVPFEIVIQVKAELSGVIVGSDHSLEMALTASLKTALYLFEGSSHRIENDAGEPIPNARMETVPDPDDGLLTDPEKDDTAYLSDRYTLTLRVPIATIQV